MIVGTAGHIDHGKTTLVRALTGVDTDRLPEEKRRGMTIDLGFAAMELPGIGPVGVVDVPGHERFVRNMVAGATGIDAVLLVVAADDGVMPQTVEHLDIVSLLGITRGVVALTKCDVADEALIEAAREEVRALMEGTALAAAPIVAVSSRTGAGLEVLREALAGVLGEARRARSDGYFRLPIDRVFTMPGFGTVVTGTIASGRIGVEEQVRLLPSGKFARVRGVQAHGRPVASAEAASRCALNLAGVEAAELHRGAMAVDPGLSHAPYTLDAQVTLSKHAAHPLDNHHRVRFHSGTAETPARIVWIGDAPQPGGSAPAQLRLRAAVPLLYGDRFVLRSEDGRATLAGGVALDCHAARRSTRSAGRVERLARLGSPQALDALIDERGAAGWEIAELAERLALLPERLGAILAERRDILREGLGSSAWVAPKRAIDAALAHVLETLERFLREHPRMTAMPLATLHAGACAQLDARIFRLLVARLCAGGKAVQTPEGIRTADHAQRFTREDEALAARIEALLDCAGGPPPRLEALARSLGMPAPRLAKFVGELERAGRIAKLAPEVYVASPQLAKWRGKALELLSERGRLGLGEFRDAIGQGRGVALLALERFDHEGLTRRVGDHRVAGRIAHLNAKNGEDDRPVASAGFKPVGRR